MFRGFARPFRFLTGLTILAALAVGSAGALSAQELRIGYMKHDIHEANVAKIGGQWSAFARFRLLDL
jgi:hypothetical protein